jgi:hypothetical protein
MMKRLILALACVVGCYDPTATIGLPCSPMGRCPDGQSCSVDGACRDHDAAPLDPPDAAAQADGSPASECATPVLPPTLAGGMLDGSPFDNGPTIQKSATVNDDDVLVVALNKSADPFGGPMSAGTYNFALAGSCEMNNTTCVTIWAYAPELGSREFRADSGTLRVTVLDTPEPPADPSGCGDHDGDIPACDADLACSYYVCSESCRPDGTTLCDAECASGCGFRMRLQEAVLVDLADPACSTAITDAIL